MMPPLIHPLAHPPLQALIRARANQPMCWGSTDCVLWVADVLHALTGRDPMADLRGRYATAWQARALLRAHGVRDLRGMLLQRLQPVADHPQDGDVGATAWRGLGAVGVRLGGRLWAQGRHGLVHPAAPVLSWWRMA